MRIRLATAAARFEFDGSPAIWNEFFRPILGGPEAPPDLRPQSPAQLAAAPIMAAPGVATSAMAAPAMSAQGVTSSAPAPQARTWYPPRDAAPRPAPENRSNDEYHRRSGRPLPTQTVEPASDPAVLYGRLNDVDSRRAEKDAVLAAVWFVGRGARDVTPEEVEKHLRDHGGPTDVRVRPSLLKHVTRTKFLDLGTAPTSVRLSAKGRAQIRLIVGE